MTITLQDLISQQKKDVLSAGERLKQRRATFDKAKNIAGERYSNSLNSSNLLPSDVFSGFQSFQKASSDYVNSGEQQDAIKNLQMLMNIQNDQKGSSISIDPTTGLPDFSNISGDDALAVVSKTGRRLLSGGLNEKKAQAQAILSYGSVDKYLQEAPLSDIYSLKSFETQKKADDNASKILSKINAAQTYFSPNAVADFWGKGNLTGPIASRKGFLRSKSQREAQAIIGELSAEKIKDLSGAAVSEQEFERLKKFLPDPGMQENEVATQLDLLNRRIKMNMKVREDAIRAGQNESSYWQANKNKYLQEFGFPSEDSEKGQELLSDDEIKALL